MSKQAAKIILKSGKDQSVLRLHPWVFSGAIKKIDGYVNEGDIVHVYNNKNEFLAAGHYQIGSIAIRIFSFKPEEYNYNFWKNKVRRAFELRKQIGLADSGHTSIYRLIYAEGDGLPGLIIDWYNGTAVMQMHSIGMHKLKDDFVEILKSIYGDKLKAIFDKSSQTLPFKGPVTAVDGSVYGSTNATEALEYNNRFYVDWESGQKTGFFIDQRENRALVAKYAADRKVLNMFGYTGGFSVYALQGRANIVHTVDSSKQAIELTQKNVELNFQNDNRHTGFATDAFDYLKDMDDDYDLIILDPPAFAKHNNVLHNALQGYKRLNALAFNKIKSGGLLFTFSCSQVVSKENFRKSVFAAAAQSGRVVRILHQLTQPEDHPVNIYHPEGEYLKGLVLYVE
ncbi:MAG: class I SAM-dependent rRNA methyltransferase [Bacteroidales bacterium]|nr:class I SAM-dependent rRNA methyltransferase [Bacteroidales bacterium]